ncbi:MAG: hypothetical protein MHM6MM_000752 [Cercozoa sp. M6MM]
MSRSRHQLPNFQIGDIIEDYSLLRRSQSRHIKRYTIDEYLGKGGFARCYKVTSHDSENVYAVKIVSKALLQKKPARQKLANEIKIHRQLRHVNLVHFERFFEDDHHVYFLLELCENKSLMDLQRARRYVTEPEARFLMKQLVGAVEWMHDQRVIHRDLKLGNVMLDRNLNVKIGDFGLAAQLDSPEQRKTTLCGTPNYIAPEILRRGETHSFEVDIWALGVIMFTLLSGTPPFETNDIKETYRRIRRAQYEWPSHCASVTADAKQLVAMCLALDPRQRPSAQQMMRHPFFTSQLALQDTPAALPECCLRRPPRRDELFGEAPVSMQRTESMPPALISHGTQFVRDALEDRPNNDAAPQPHMPQFPPQQMPVLPSLGEIHNHGMPMDLPKSPPPEQMISDPPFPPLWAVRWVDYSHKYGLGYALSNGCTGVYFNDVTKMVLTPCGRFVRYIDYIDNEDEMRGADGHHRDVAVAQARARAASVVFPIDQVPDTPRDLQKKTTLLRHFTEHLRQSADVDVDADQLRGMSLQDAKYLPYIDRWGRTSHATLFHFDDNSAQINFSDRSEIVYVHKNNSIVYTNKHNERFGTSLQQALETQRPDLRKRIKYMHHLLRQINDDAAEN